MEVTPRNVPSAQRAGITKGLDHFQKFRAQFRVAGDGAGFDEHHALPGLAPLGVKSLEAGKRADERAGRAFRAQAQVHAVERALRRQAGDFGDHAFGQAGEEQMAGHAFAGLFAGTRAAF